MLYRTRRSKTGGALVETVAGLFVLIPVVLFLIDVVAMVLAQMAHDALAKDCARAAAEEKNGGAAATAVNGVIAGFSCPTLVVNPPPIVDFNTGTGTVRVQTNSTFTFPVPIPFWGDSNQQFVAEAQEPIVGILPP